MYLAGCPYLDLGLLNADIIKVWLRILYDHGSALEVDFVGWSDDYMTHLAYYISDLATQVV